MKQQLEQRLKELRAEFDSGQRNLGELEIKQANLRNTLLRISGAIQVLEEELARESQAEPKDLGFEEVPKIEPITE
ncbi:MAG: hypothetical protein O8C64_11510 [Candidatus Methanoperedens sp.]|nr:hypothetical protein [Candidatus Methanoperedens sp.]MCZ7405701.1 hypothetical protein [Candidatus Methanoperedens sp.]